MLLHVDLQTTASNFGIICNKVLFLSFLYTVFIDCPINYFIKHLLSICNKKHCLKLQRGKQSQKESLDWEMGERS